MLTFLRKIRKILIDSLPASEGTAKQAGGSARRYLLYATGEVLLVMVGILLALQVNNWNEANKNTKKGLEYLNALYDDLLQDSLHFSYLIGQYEIKMDTLSTIEDCYDSIIAQSSEDCIRSLMSVSRYFDNLRNVDRTIQILKYEGGSSLLSSEDWSKVLEYDMTIASYKVDETTVFQETQTSLRTLMHELVDFGALDNKSNKVLIRNDLILNKYFNTLRLYRGYCSNYIDQLRFIMDINSQLKLYLKKKYKFN